MNMNEELKAPQRSRIAVFAGPTATILNTPDLVTSSKARKKHGLSERLDRFDGLRSQRLAARATVFIEAFTAHPLESDATHLYCAPDGWLDNAGTFHADRPGGVDAVPVFVAELLPEDGLYLLPYMARQADGSAWEETGTNTLASPDASRQTFYPDARRLYEEIERFGLSDIGKAVQLSAIADFDFFRAAPSGGYTIDSERLGQDFFGYYPYHLQSEPSLAHLAEITNHVQKILDSRDYDGMQWLEGSPTVDETLYWFGLLLDTTVPVVGHCGQRRHQSLSADGARNVVDGVKYIAARTALNGEGVDRVGACLIVDELVYAARDVAKVDARPGGYEVTGGHGGIVCDIGGYGPPQLTYLPTRKHTYKSDLRVTSLPDSVTGVGGSLDTAVHTVKVSVKESNELIADAVPHVSITKYGRYSAPHSLGSVDSVAEVEIVARIQENLRSSPLAGFVCEGMSPFAMADPVKNAALTLALFAGMPVVRVGRGNTGGMAYKTDPLFIAGNNLTATKARILLMAALLKLGALPPVDNPYNPRPEERAATERAVARYQQIFDTH